MALLGASDDDFLDTGSSGDMYSILTQSPATNSSARGALGGFVLSGLDPTDTPAIKIAFKPASKASNPEYIRFNDVVSQAVLPDFSPNPNTGDFDLTLRMVRRRSPIHHSMCFEEHFFQKARRRYAPAERASTGLQHHAQRQILPCWGQGERSRQQD
jgi:hypothetical protein